MVILRTASPPLLDRDVSYAGLCDYAFMLSLPILWPRADGGAQQTPFLMIIDWSKHSGQAVGMF